MIKSLAAFIEDNFTKRDTIFLSLVSLLFVLLRLPSLFEPYWYGDEGIYEVIGIALRQGRVLYSQIWDNKPPVLYLIYALFNGDLFYVKLASLIVGFASVVVFFLVAKKLFKNFISIFVSTMIFALGFGLPIIEGNIANAENFIILPIITAFYLLFCVDSKNYFKRTVAAALLLSLAFLTKIVALFDLAAFLTIIFALGIFNKGMFNFKNIILESKKLLNTKSQIFILISFFLVPVFLTVVYFLLVNALPDFFKAAFTENIGYVGYGNYFIFPMGFLILKIVILLATIIGAFKFRSTLTRVGFIIFVWTVVALFSSYFSNRPYTHYMLVLLAPFSLFTGFVFEKKNLLKITLPLLLIIFLIVDYNFSFYKKNLPYYKNFAEYISGGPINKYQNFFDSNTTRDYDVANFVRANLTPAENIFLWGDSAQIYALSGKLPPGRYTVMYHITSFPNAIQETKAAIEKASPRFIIQTKGNEAISNFTNGYQFKYKVDDAVIYEKQF